LLNCTRDSKDPSTLSTVSKQHVERYQLLVVQAMLLVWTGLNYDLMWKWLQSVVFRFMWYRGQHWRFGLIMRQPKYKRVHKWRNDACRRTTESKFPTFGENVHWPDP